MLRDPEGAHRVEAAAAGYLADTAQALGLPGPEQIAPEKLSKLNLGELASKAALAIIESRQLLEVNEKAVATLFGSFIPAVIDARAAAHDIALTQGQFTAMDEASLAQAGAGLENIHEYLAPFGFQEDAAWPSDIPPIGINTILRIKGAGLRGRDGYVGNMYGLHSVVDSSTEWPSFASNFNVPVLVDPKIYTVEEFANMPEESADGYAEQVVDTWRSIQESERDHPSFTGEPLVIRAVAVLPVPPAETSAESEFAVDFLPQVAKTQADIDGNVKRAYDVRLLVKGSKNLGGNYLTFEFGDAPQPVYANSQGKRATLTVQRGQAIEDGLPASATDLGLTPRSQGAIAMYIAPHIVKPREPIPAPSIVGFGGGEGLMFGSRDAPKGLGAAQVSVGPASSWMTSIRKTEGFSGHVAPELLGRPVIVSLQLLTFER